jgi:hypothetical protein
VQGSHAWRADSAIFDEDNLVSHAGLVPLLELAEQAGLSRLLNEHVRFTSEWVKSGAANATAKLTSIIAGMAAGADSIDDLDVIRAGGMKKLFGGVYACSTLGIFLRVNTAKACGAQVPNILVRGDSAFCSGKVVAAVVKAGARFSFAIAGNPAVDAAINSIPDDRYVPVAYPGAVTDPDTGELISEAQVSEVEYTAFAGTRYEITARLIVRRVLDADTQDPPVPGLALPRVPHQQHRTRHTGRHHPPRPCHLRDRLVRPHRWPLGTPALRLVRRQRRLDRPRRDHPQPAARRRHADRHRPLCRRPRRHPTHPPDQPGGPFRPPATPTRAASAQPFAQSRPLARLLAGRLRHLTAKPTAAHTTTHHTATDPTSRTEHTGHPDQRAGHAPNRQDHPADPQRSRHAPSTD